MEERSSGGRPERERTVNGTSPDFLTFVFLNNNGLRAIWRLLIYAFLLFALLVASTYVLTALFRRAHGVSSPWGEFAGELASLAAVVLAAWLMSLIEGRSFGMYGLPAQGAFGKLFWQGCLFGLFEVCVLIGAIATFGGYSFGSLADHGVEVFRWAIFWGVFFLVVGFFEEFLFRGYALYTLADGMSFWPAAVLLAGCFGYVHRFNEGENWIGVAGVVLVGLFWSFTLKRTGSLWFAVGMHATFDFGETFVFSVPDSGMLFPGHLSNATLHGPAWLTGGAPGPEASVIDFVILALFFFVVDRLYPAKPAETPAVTLDPAA